MPALIDTLAVVGASCPELEAWRVCGSGGEEHCETCALGGPWRCENEVIKALVRRLADVQKL